MDTYKDEKSLFTIKNYSRNFTLISFLYFGVFFFILGSNFTNVDYMIVSRVGGGIMLIGIAIFIFLFKKSKNIVFFDDKIIQTNLFSIKHRNIVEKIDNVDEIYIFPNLFQHHSWFLYGSEKEKKDFIGVNWFYGVIMLPGLLLLELFGIMKSRKTEFIVIGDIEIMLSELSQGEYVNLNRFLKEKFDIYIKDIKRVNLDGKITDPKQSSENLWS
ncbi:MAG: hypothetical protein J6W17_03975 [Campylobacter sp.]|nr:hypothetical protein [Campylobacter sp.]